MEKDGILLAGTIAGFIVAVLSIFEKTLDLKARFRATETEQPKERPPRPEPEPAPRRPPPRWKAINVSGYLLWYELAVIVATGLLLNYIGLLLSLRLQSILYLDMIGTALAALLLGPWWGALVALLSSSVVNALLYPDPGSEVVIAPWVLVNMAGGFCWGIMARTAVFRHYVKTPHASAAAHARYLATFGGLGACAMAVPGTVIQVALAQPSVFALHPDVARTVERVIVTSQHLFQDHVGSLFGAGYGERAAWAVFTWIQTCIRYLPDKTISVAIALTLVKYAFPLFERELISGQGKPRFRDTAGAPLILGALYLPIFLALLVVHEQLRPYWPLWSAPWILIVGGLVALQRWGLSDEEASASCRSRADRYERALRPVRREPAHEFGQRLTVATLLTSLLFVLVLPALLADFYQAAFNFFCVVYGFLVAVYLIRVIVSQNLSIARAEK